MDIDHEPPQSSSTASTLNGHTQPSKDAISTPNKSVQLKFKMPVGSIAISASGNKSRGSTPGTGSEISSGRKNPKSEPPQPSPPITASAETSSNPLQNGEHLTVDDEDDDLDDLSSPPSSNKSLGDLGEEIGFEGERHGDDEMEPDGDLSLAPDTPYTGEQQSASASASATATATPSAGAQPAVASSASLSIFAPPGGQSSSPLPDALQRVLAKGKGKSNGNGAQNSSVARARKLRERGPTLATPISVTAGLDHDGDSIMKDATEGLSRLRPVRGKDIGLAARAKAAEDGEIRAGVSASGRGVKVSGAQRVAAAAAARKSRGAAQQVPNQDFCSACRGIGRFLCCDGCPRSFHFMCLEPPLRVDELPDTDEWFCRECQAEKRGLKPISPVGSEDDPKPIQTVFKFLCKKAARENPTTFKLPDDIKQFFLGVGESQHGEYMDVDEARTRYDRKGFQEDRDPLRLKDGKHRPMSCYACGGSSIPRHALTTDPGAVGRQIVSCDYCPLSWHLDCMNPPLPSMPNSGKKWMCPNHAEQVMTRRRTIRSGIEMVDVDERNSRNNGNVVIIDDDDLPPLEFEDLIINKKKYRIPEKIIRLDFWEKIGLAKKKRKRPTRSTSSSSGSESDEEVVEEKAATPPPAQPRTATREDLEAAGLMLNIFNPGFVLPPIPTQPPMMPQSTQRRLAPQVPRDPTQPSLALPAPSSNPAPLNSLAPVQTLAQALPQRYPQTATMGQDQQVSRNGTSQQTAYTPHRPGPPVNVQVGQTSTRGSFSDSLTNFEQAQQTPSQTQTQSHSRSHTQTQPGPASSPQASVRSSTPSVVRASPAALQQFMADPVPPLFPYSLLQQNQTHMNSSPFNQTNSSSSTPGQNHNQPFNQANQRRPSSTSHSQGQSISPNPDNYHLQYPRLSISGWSPGDIPIPATYQQDHGGSGGVSYNPISSPRHNQQQRPSTHQQNHGHTTSIYGNHDRGYGQRYGDDRERYGGTERNDLTGSHNGHTPQTTGSTSSGRSDGTGTGVGLGLENGQNGQPTRKITLKLNSRPS